MALQGTLDTFELPDVLRLLASTRKTGRLTLRGDRGEGDVWLDDGQAVGILTADATTELVDGFFELLRAREGSFSFEPGDAPASPVPPADVEPLLTAAEAQLEEWRAIEAVVPSLDAWLALAPELPGGSVTVDAATWRLVAAIGSGLSVGDLGQVLGLAEVPVSRLVRDLVELGLGAIGPAPAPSLARAVDIVPADDLEPVDEPAYELPVDEAPWFEPAPEPPVPLFAVQSPVEPAPTLTSSPFGPPIEPADDPVHHADTVTDTDDVTRQLAMLSPRAAEAVAAAAASNTDEDRQAALDAVEESDEPLNRGLLLKFLGSVKA